jgi:hypothetical protein
MNTESTPEAICQSCGVPYRDHLGLVGTCAALKEALAELADRKARMHTMARELGNARASDDRHVRDIEACYSVQKRLTEERDALAAALRKVDACDPFSPIPHYILGEISALLGAKYKP